MPLPVESLGGFDFRNGGLGGFDNMLGGDAQVDHVLSTVALQAELLDGNRLAVGAEVLVPRMATPASTETRALTEAGSTASLYSASCSSNHSRDGADTTRALMPSPARVLAAETAHCTSEPVAMIMTSGVPRCRQARKRLLDAVLGLLSGFGKNRNAWRVSTMAAGRVFFFSKK